MNPLNPRLQELQELLPTFLANYTKRFLEKGYDRAFQTGLGQKLAGLSPGKKYGIEFALYTLAAFFDSRLAGNTKLRKFAKEVGIDAAPEIAKRMINGAREEIPLSASTPEEKELAQLLLGLEDKELKEIISWLYEKDISEKMAILARLATLSTTETVRLLNLSAEEREKFFSVLKPQPQSEPTFGDVLRQDMAKGAERLRETKERMRQKRKRGRQ